MYQWSCFLLLLLFCVSTDVVSAACGDLIAPDPCVAPTDDNCLGCTAATTNVPDPFDCRSFYVCSKATIAFDGKPFDCPDGQVFDSDPSALQCKPGTSCSPICSAPVGGECLYTCAAKPNTVLADPYDCSIYYECSGTSKGPAQGCPSSTPYFDGASCQKDLSSCCHCHPYCYAHEKGALVADPRDCRKYYGCLDEGEPAFSGKCPLGEYFDAHLRECSASAPCITLCKNVVGSNGCIDPYTCEAEGYFAKCPSQCVPEYYHCTEAGDTYVDSEVCGDGYLFNPDDLICVKNGTCPYE